MCCLTFRFHRIVRLHIQGEVAELISGFFYRLSPNIAAKELFKVVHICRCYKSDSLLWAMVKHVVASVSVVCMAGWSRDKMEDHHHHAAYTSAAAASAL